MACEARNCRPSRQGCAMKPQSMAGDWRTKAVRYGKAVAEAIFEDYSDIDRGDARR